MISWMPTAAGLIAAIGVAFLGSGEPVLHLPGVILSCIGTAALGLVAKQFNIHGGTVAAPTPPEVAAKVMGTAIPPCKPYPTEKDHD